MKQDSRGGLTRVSAIRPHRRFAVGRGPKVTEQRQVPFYRNFEAPYGQLTEVAHHIRRLLAHNPSPFTFKGTGVYVVGRGRVVVIDPGPDDPQHLDSLRR